MYFFSATSFIVFPPFNWNDNTSWNSTSFWKLHHSIGYSRSPSTTTRVQQYNYTKGLCVAREYTCCLCVCVCVGGGVISRGRFVAPRDRSSGAVLMHCNLIEHGNCQDSRVFRWTTYLSWLYISGFHLALHSSDCVRTNLLFINKIIWLSILSFLDSWQLR